jgi:hypothetical protein
VSGCVEVGIMGRADGVILYGCLLVWRSVCDGFIWTIDIEDCGSGTSAKPLFTMLTVY